MTRVLVVHHDVDVADIEADLLRRAGYEVTECAGPIDGGSCPVLNGTPCWQVEEADVLLYDMWASGDGSSDLIEDVRDLHPDKPIVLTSPGLVLNWVRTEGPHGVTPLVGPTTGTSLIAAVESALASGPEVQPADAARPRRERPRPTTPHLPRW
jgi:DNA-binding NtrC family response regulator